MQQHFVCIYIYIYIYVCVMNKMGILLLCWSIFFSYFLTSFDYRVSSGEKVFVEKKFFRKIFKKLYIKARTKTWSDDCIDKTLTVTQDRWLCVYAILTDIKDFIRTLISWEVFTQRWMLVEITGAKKMFLSKNMLTWI